MHRALFVSVIALAGAPAGLATPASGPPGPAQAYLRSFVCRRALDPAKRTVSVTAVMGTIGGTRSLQMRFQLSGRAGRTVTLVRGGDLGHWISPSPPTLGQQAGDVWVVNHPVTGLRAPASYRFRVAFRWLGAGGRIIAAVVRTSASCRQPDLRPDLLVHSIAVQPVAGNPGQDQYVAEIDNAGPSAANAVAVLFAPGGGLPPQTVTITRLAAHSSQTETFIGPACTAVPAPTITVDPYRKIGDSDRGNNSLTATCPSPTGG